MSRRNFNTQQGNHRQQTLLLTCNPWCVLAHLYHWAKFGWNQCSSFGCYVLAIWEYTWKSFLPLNQQHWTIEGNSNH